MALSMPGANLIPVGLQLLVHDSPFRCYTDYTQFGHTPLVSTKETQVFLLCINREFDEEDVSVFKMEMISLAAKLMPGAFLP